MLARGMVESKRPAYTGEEIIETVRREFDEHLNKNNVTQLRALVSAEHADKERIAVHRQALAQNIARELDLGDDGAAWLDDVLTTAILANETDLGDVDPARLTRLLISNRRAALAERKLDNDAERLKLANKKLQLEVEARERDLAKERAAEAERKRVLEAGLAKADAAPAAADRERIALEAIKNSLGVS